MSKDQLLVLRTSISTVRSKVVLKSAIWVQTLQIDRLFNSGEVKNPLISYRHYSVEPTTKQYRNSYRVSLVLWSHLIFIMAWINGEHHVPITFCSERGWGDISSKTTWEISSNRISFNSILSKPNWRKIPTETSRNSDLQSRNIKQCHVFIQLEELS